MILRRISDAFRRQDWFTVAVETLIVVLGVFLGLQVSNLNAERQLKQQELELLRLLADDLKSNIRQLDENVAFDRSSIAACDEILLLVEQGNAWSREDGLKMGTCRGWTSPSFNAYAFENLQSLGVDILSNADLRRNVSELYNLTYAALRDDRDRSFWVYHQAVMMPVFAKYLVYPPDQSDAGRGGRRLMPQDHEVLSASPELKSVLLGKRAYQTWSIDDQVNARKVSQGVLDELEAELAK